MNVFVWLFCVPILSYKAWSLIIKLAGLLL